MNNSSTSSRSSFPPAASIAVSGTTLAPAVASASVEQIRALETAETTKLKRAEEAKAKAEALINSSMERLELIYQWYELAEQASNLAAQQSQVASELNELRNQESQLLANLAQIEQERQRLSGDLALPLFPTNNTPGVWERGRYSHDGLARLEKALAEPATKLTIIDGSTVRLNGHFPSPNPNHQSEPSVPELITLPPANNLPPDINPTEESSEDEEKKFGFGFGFGCNPWWQLSEVDLVAMEDTKASHPNPFVRKWLNQAAQAVRSGDWVTAANQFTRLTRGAGKDSFFAWLGYAASFSDSDPGNLREVKLALETAYPLKDDERIDTALFGIYDLEKPPTKPAVAKTLPPEAPVPLHVATVASSTTLPAAAEKEEVVVSASLGNKPVTQTDNKIGTQSTIAQVADTATDLYPELEGAVESASYDTGEEADFGEDLTFGIESESAATDYASHVSQGIHANVTSHSRDTAEASISGKVGEGSQPTASFSGSGSGNGSSIATNNGRTRTHK